MAIGQIVGGLAQTVGSFIGGRARRREQAEARQEVQRYKAAYQNLDTSNPYANITNPYEDLTVNTQAANFAAQQSAQGAANIMNTMSAAAGGDIFSFHEYGAGVNVNSSHTFDTNLDTNRWYYFTFTRNITSNEIKIYIDGELFDDVFTGWSNPTGGSVGTLRFAENQTGAHYAGKINHIKIYNKTLTSSEVRHNYNQTLIDFL